MKLLERVKKFCQKKEMIDTDFERQLQRDKFASTVLGHFNTECCESGAPDAFQAEFKADFQNIAKKAQNFVAEQPEAFNGFTDPKAKAMLDKMYKDIKASADKSWSPFTDPNFKWGTSEYNMFSEMMTQHAKGENIDTEKADYIFHQKLATWLRFKELHPNSPEIPDYSDASVARWEYHIQEAEKNTGFEKVELDVLDIEEIRAERSVKRFEDFDHFQKDAYNRLARAFPGVQVYACGSQVRGDWFGPSMCQQDINDVVDSRKKAGMRVDRMSDYDFWVDGDDVQSEPLPCHFDRFRGKFSKEMIPIPIYYG